jgi:hypothetical protein
MVLCLPNRDWQCPILAEEPPRGTAHSPITARGLSCPQQAPKVRADWLRPDRCHSRALLRTGMSARRPLKIVVV